jgi:soluble lytic murein transglycosylase-like protein
MAALIRSAALALALAVQPAKASGDVPAASQPVFTAPPAVEHWRSFITEASRRFAIPETWIAAVMRAESAGLTAWNGRPITSRAGAMGLMQVMPGTWDTMRRLHHLGPDPYDPHDNIMAGAAYLRAMHDRFGYPGLFGAYNAGPARYEAYLDGRGGLPGETQGYITELARTPATPSMPPAILSGTRLFFTLGAANTAPHDAGSAPPKVVSRLAASPSVQPPPNMLFVPLAAVIGPAPHP